MSAVPKHVLVTHVHKKLLQMYGKNKNKNLYITYNSVRNININNNTPKKIQYNIIYNIYNIIKNPSLKKKIQFNSILVSFRSKLDKQQL